MHGKHRLHLLYIANHHSNLKHLITSFDVMFLLFLKLLSLLCDGKLGQESTRKFLGTLQREDMSVHASVLT